MLTALSLERPQPKGLEAALLTPFLDRVFDGVPVLPGLCLALVDEADSVLLDEATVPLILAAPADAVEIDSYGRAMAMARAHDGVTLIHVAVSPDKRAPGYDEVTVNACSSPQ